MLTCITLNPLFMRVLYESERESDISVLLSGPGFNSTSPDLVVISVNRNRFTRMSDTKTVREIYTQRKKLSTPGYFG